MAVSYTHLDVYKRQPLDTRTIMRDVIIALAPATLAAIVLFGVNALLLFAVSVPVSYTHLDVYKRQSPNCDSGYWPCRTPRR